MDPVSVATAFALMVVSGAASKAGGDAWDKVIENTGAGRAEALIKVSRWDHLIGLLEEIRDAVKDQQIPVGDAAAVFKKSAEAREKSADPRKLDGQGG